MLCYDSVGGRYFEITDEKLKEIVLDNEFDVLNSFYEFVGLPELDFGPLKCCWEWHKVRAIIHFGSCADGKECVIFEFERQIWI